MSSWDEFKSHLDKRHPGILVSSEPRIGSANSARFLAGGLKIGMPNLRGRRTQKEALRKGVSWAYAGKLLLPGTHDAEIYVALVFAGEHLSALLARLDQIEALHVGDPGSAPTNNTRLVLHSSGLYANVLPESESIDPMSNMSGYGKPIPILEILYADIERVGELSAAEIDVIARLKANYSHPDRVLRLEPNGNVVKPAERPGDLSLDSLRHRVQELGGYYSNEVLETLHLNLTHHESKHFVILRGISGTGKSRLAKCYAYAVLGANNLRTEHARFVVVPVEPQWSDPTHLVGHHDVLDPKGYARTPFFDALLLANSDPQQPVFVLVDEMNRAQVEHYFSNFLSAMEMEGSIHFHMSEVAAKAGFPEAIRWPKNLYLIGTINDDESVVPFSPMVLDRANSQDLSFVDVHGYSSWLRLREPQLSAALSDEVVKLLGELSYVLEPFQLHFGNRTIRELAMYLKRAADIGSTVNALDQQIDQKILPKLHGGEESSQMLAALGGLLRSYPISFNRIQRMKLDLDSVDFFKYR